MANADQPSGFKPFGKICHIGRYVAGGTVYEGDMVELDSGGGLVAASAAGPFMGVAANYATTGQDLFVYDDPFQEFVGQADESDINAQTDLGNNMDLVVTAGNATYQRSRHELDSSTIATTATLGVRLLRILNAPDNAYGEFCKCVFVINTHQRGGQPAVASVIAGI